MTRDMESERETMLGRAGDIVVVKSGSGKIRAASKLLFKHLAAEAEIASACDRPAKLQLHGVL